MQMVGDHFDAATWKRHDLLKVPGNMGLILNADGLSIFKSSKYSVWPVFVMNGNLPPEER
jgi:hypothetical protein